MASLRAASLSCRPTNRNLCCFFSAPSPTSLNSNTSSTPYSICSTRLSPSLLTKLPLQRITCCPSAFSQRSTPMYCSNESLSNRPPSNSKCTLCMSLIYDPSVCMQPPWHSCLTTSTLSSFSIRNSRGVWAYKVSLIAAVGFTFLTRSLICSKSVPPGSKSTLLRRTLSA